MHVIKYIVNWLKLLVLCIVVRVLVEVVFTYVTEGTLPLFTSKHLQITIIAWSIIISFIFHNIIYVKK